ncbi:hypothetical protein FACS1894198_5570 [Clostridia bacterium]|nr:hypothetical protein FACS1894198_5570 [Clostridia bacterium]
MGHVGAGKITFGTEPRSFEDSMANDITFCVTEECNLRCKYCYLVGKNGDKKMTFETAKRAVDYVLSARDIYREKSVVWNFIGGEPLLEIDLIDKICDYIKDRTYLTGHLWFHNYMFNFSTNGLLYDSPKVQNFIQKNKEHSSIGISVDGNKIKHDMQRVYPDGRGSYDDVVKNVPLWLSQNEGASTKATFSHDDLPYLKDSILHLWNLGIKEVMANVVFEDVWEKDDSAIFENQLRELADYVIENNIFDGSGYNVRFFDPSVGFPITKNTLKERHCGAGKMLAIDCGGNFFPCIRFVEFSLEKQKAFKIGDVNTGVILDRLKPFKYTTLEKISNQECLSCDVAVGCMSCVGFSYDDSQDGSIYKRATYICDMHKANVRAIEYFWDKVNAKLGGRENPREVQRKIREKSNKYLAICVSDEESPSYCSYSNEKKWGEKLRMSDSLIKKSVEFALSNGFTPVFVGDTPLYRDYVRIVNAGTPYAKPQNVMVVFEKMIWKGVDAPFAILIVTKTNLKSINRSAKDLFEFCGTKKLTIVLRGIEKFDDEDLRIYEEQLGLILDFVVSSGGELDVNIFDKRSLHEDLEVNYAKGCGCGTLSFAVAPNGKLYVCLGLYYQDEGFSVGDLDKGLNFDYGEQFEDDYSDECGHCRNSKCNRCIYLNKMLTNEYSVPADIQCRIGALESRLHRDFVARFREGTEERTRRLWA